jgi:hypothetical protein
MNLESDKRLIQLRLDFSSAPTGEARQARREDIESLSVVSEPQRPTNTLCLERVSATSRTAVYGPVRTVVWEGRSREAPPYPDLCDLTGHVADMSKSTLMTHSGHSGGLGNRRRNWSALGMASCRNCLGS